MYVRRRFFFMFATFVLCLSLKVMDHLEKNREVFEPYVEDDESFDNYLGRMRGEAEWGGNQELVAASQLYEVRRDGRNER